MITSPVPTRPSANRLATAVSPNPRPRSDRTSALPQLPEGIAEVSAARAGRRGDGGRPVAVGRSGAVVEGDVVAVGVGEGEGAAEGTVDRSGDDGGAVGGEGGV